MNSPELFVNNALIRLIGWRASIVHGDPSVFDRWLWLRRHLQPGPLRTLDAGCGSGAFTMYAAMIGNESVGISYDERNNAVATSRARMLGIRKVRFCTIDLRDLDQYSESLGAFDQIICCETIEHILNDKKLLADLSGLLKPAGRLLLTTPFKHAIPLWGDRVSECEDGSHVRRGYTHAEMRDLLGACGMEVRAEEYLSGCVSRHLVAATRTLSRVNPTIAWVATFPLRVFQVVDKNLTKAIRYPFMTIAIVAAKRP